MKLELKRTQKPFGFEIENASGARTFADASPEIGGNNAGLRPMELLASGLASCIAIDVLLILQKQRQEPTVFAISIDGTRTEGTPSPFQAIHLIFTVDADIDRTKLNKNIQLVIDKYCSVRASLDGSIAITFEINPHETT